jgi:hypothetical protein
MVDSVTGQDTLTLFDRNIVDLADNDAVLVAFPNDLVGLSTGKNGNTVFAKNEQGSNADVTMRIIMGSADDRFLQGKLRVAEQDFAAQELATGQFTKRVGRGDGTITRTVYTLEAGVFLRRIDGKENPGGDTEQSVAIYRMRFARASRSNQ